MRALSGSSTWPRIPDLGAATGAEAGRAGRMRPRGAIVFHLRPVPPFHLNLAAWALRRRRENATDRLDSGRTGASSSWRTGRTFGIRQMNRLSAGFGRPVGADAYVQPAFSIAEGSARGEPDGLRTWRSAETRPAPSSIWRVRPPVGNVGFGALAALDDRQAADQLQSLRGVGRWTAVYVLLRDLDRLHVLLGDDIGARHNRRRRLRLAAPLEYAGVQRVLGPWRYDAGLTYFYLLLDRLAAAGHMAASASAQPTKATQVCGLALAWPGSRVLPPAPSSLRWRKDAPVLACHPPGGVGRAGWVVGPRRARVARARRVGNAGTARTAAGGT